MAVRITQAANPNFGELRQVVNKQKPAEALLHRSSNRLEFSNLTEKNGFHALSTNHGRLEKFNYNRRNFAIYSSIEPGIPPSGPPSNTLTWIVAVALAIVVPIVGSHWKPSLRRKMENVIQTTEDVAEAVEKVAEAVDKAAEELGGDLPADGKLRQVADFVEELAERTAKDAKLVDDFIDKVQEEEERIDSFVVSVKDESKETPAEVIIEQKPNND